jgi:hypothetical protein
MCQMESLKRTLTMMPLAHLVCLQLDINRCGWDSPFLGSFQYISIHGSMNMHFRDKNRHYPFYA